MRLVDQAFVKTIIDLKKQFGSLRALASHLGVSEMQLSRWHRGRGEAIKEKTYAKIHPQIKDLYQKHKAEEKVLFSDFPYADLLNSLSDEDFAILRHFRDPNHKRERYLLLLKIEESKKL